MGIGIGTEEQIGKSYRRNTIHEHQDAGLDIYERELGFNRADLEGKTILDLGSGSTDLFAREVEAAGINANVISLSPDFQTASTRKTLLRGNPDRKVNAVTAIAQALPFKDSSIDMILSNYAVTYAASDYPEQVKAWVAEIGRVLKPEGEARLGPNYGETPGFGKNYGILTENAEKAGLQVEVHEEKYILLRKSPIQKKSKHES